MSSFFLSSEIGNPRQPVAVDNAPDDTASEEIHSFTKNTQPGTSRLATGRVRPMADFERQSFRASAIERWMFDVFVISSNHRAFL
jgi:hypothetical protein